MRTFDFYFDYKKTYTYGYCKFILNPHICMTNYKMDEEDVDIDLLYIGNN